MSTHNQLDTNWIFTKKGQKECVTLPHTWNAKDGQDGGNDYYRGTCSYEKTFARPDIPEDGRAILQIGGAAMSAAVFVNGKKAVEHKGGYSAFRADITDLLQENNTIRIEVDNSENDTVYPQKADFTFMEGFTGQFLLSLYRRHTLHWQRTERFQ